MNELMANAGFEILNEGFKNQWNPNNEAKKAALDFGRTIVLKKIIADRQDTEPV